MLQTSTWCRRDSTSRQLHRERLTEACAELRPAMGGGIEFCCKYFTCRYFGREFEWALLRTSSERVFLAIEEILEVLIGCLGLLVV